MRNETLKILIESNNEDFTMRTTGDCSFAYLMSNIEIALKRLAEVQLNIPYKDLLLTLMIAGELDD